MAKKKKIKFNFKRKPKRTKVSPIFSNVLFLISILGFTSLISEFFGIITIPTVIKWFAIIILGGGLMIEGGIRIFLKYFKNGLTVVELAHILTIVVGIIVFASGIIGAITGTIPDHFKGIVGTVYIFSLIVTIYERWI